MNFLKDLNEQQLKAVTAPLGPVLVLAGAGSGKTRALTYRLAYLIQTHTFNPAEILAVTFTNKAANEMRERVEGLLKRGAMGERGERGVMGKRGGMGEMGERGFETFKPLTPPTSFTTLTSPSPTMGTFHSVCARLLRKEIHHLPPFTNSFTIFDDDDTLRALRQIIQGFNWQKEISPNFARSVISSIKNEQIAPELVDQEDFSKIYKAYNNLLEELNALDFDDLLLTAVRLFREKPKVLNKYRRVWPYVLVDEYQDTNNIQYQLVKLLVDEHRHIFAVGDDAQSIYGFRGANYRNILNFEKDFPEATVITLAKNYRSTGNILAAANAVIALSPEQKKKKLWTQNPIGGKIIRHTAVDEIGEAVFVAGEILQLAAQGKNHDSPAGELVYEYDEDPFASATPLLDRLMGNAGQTARRRPHFLPQKADLDRDQLKEIVILYRTNAQSRALEEAMLQFGIPYHLVGAIRFYERKEIKDVLSFLRLVVNPSDWLALNRVANVPPRGLGDKSLQALRAGNLSELSARARNAWQVFEGKLQSIRRSSPDYNLVEIIELILKKFDLEDYYRDGTNEGEDRWANVKELFTAARRADMPWPQAVVEFLEEIALYSATDEVGSKTGVTLMTLHQAKGLEFKTVFMVGLEEGMLPHMKSLESGEIAEEIRLAYVGITRARKNLYLINAHARRIFGSTYTLKPSRVLKALPEDLIERRE